MPTASSSAQFLNSLTNEPDLTQSIGVGLGFRPVTQKPIARELEQSFLNAPPPNNLWGKHVIGPSPAPGLGLQIKFRLFWMRLRNVLFGSPWPVGTKLTMDNAMSKYAMFERLDFTSAFTIYYAPGMDGALIGLQTISGTNQTTKGPSVVRMPLKELLALNGYTLVELRPNVIKVYPTKSAAKYASEVIDETKYP